MLIEFQSGYDMLKQLDVCDLYSPSQRQYVFSYNDRGAICVYYLTLKEAKALERKSRHMDEYWGAFLGCGGNIWDDPDDPYFTPANGHSNIDYCKEMYSCDWINTHDVLDYEEVEETF